MKKTTRTNQIKQTGPKTNFETCAYRDNRKGKGRFDVMTMETMAGLIKLANGESFGIKTGFKDFDNCLWGMRCGNKIVVAGRPGSGKTDFALNTLFNASVMQKKSCVFFSLEMTKEEISRRLLSIGGAIDSADIISGNAMKKDETLVMRIRDLLGNGKLFIDDTTNQNPAQLLAKAKKHKRKYGLDLIVIDYLGKIKPPRRLNNPVTETGEIARAVKDMARTLQVPVLCLAQLNRNSERKDGKQSELLMSDLRGSGEIEQEADVIAFLVPEPKELENETRTIYLQMAKNRHGRMKNIKFEFTGKYHTFKELCSAEYKSKTTSVQEKLPY